MPDATLLPADTPRTLVLGEVVASGVPAGGVLPHGPSLPRAALRAMGPDDWPLEQALSRDPEVVRWTFGPADLDDVAAQERAATAADRWSARAAARFVILDDDGPAGDAGLTLPSGIPEVFYALLPGHRGRGLATRAADALASWALATGYPRVHLLTLAGNAASEAVARRAGFVAGDTRTVVRDGVVRTITIWYRTA